MDGVSDPCEKSGIGSRSKCRYSENFEPINEQPHLYTCHTNIKMGPFLFYGVFSGFNGGDEAAKYVMNQLVHVIFKEQPITVAQKPEDVITSLKQKYERVVQEYMQTHGDTLSNRLLVQENISNHLSIEEINDRISRGTTLIVALIIQNDMYIISCGRSIAVIIQDSYAGDDIPIQLNDIIHENTNEEEIDRLLHLQVDPDKVENPTRAIGDLHRSLFYTEIDDFKNATGPPVISEPLVQHHMIRENWKYLILLSDGVVENLKKMNTDNIPSTVLKYLREEQTPRNTAQALVDAFSRNHLDFVSSSTTVHHSLNVMEEMTVLFHELASYKSFAFTSESTNDSRELIGNTSYTGIPYVDAKHDSQSENFKNMEEYLLKLT